MLPPLALLLAAALITYTLTRRLRSAGGRQRTHKHKQKPMFKINPAPTFTREVKITVPGQDEPGILKLQFKYMDREQRLAWQKGLEGRTDDDVIPEIVTGWFEVVDDSQDPPVPVPYSADALRQVLRSYEGSATEIYQAWLTGLTESRAKN